MAVPFSFHWYDSGAVPVAVTLNVAVDGAVTVWFCGCVVIEGATDEGVVEEAVEELPPPPQLGSTRHANDDNREISVKVHKRSIRIFTTYLQLEDF